MNRILLLLILMLSSMLTNAQLVENNLVVHNSTYQNLEDPRYIYSLDAENRDAHAIARNLTKDKYVAVYYNGRIYKDVHLLSFVYDSALIYHDIRWCFRRKERRQYTKDRSIKNLYIVGKYDSGRKFLSEYPEFRKLLK